MQVFAGKGNGKEILRELTNAQFSIRILSYLLLSPRYSKSSGITQTFFDIINKKVSEGVTVQILCNDKFPTAWLKSKLENERYKLRKIGAIVKTYPRKSILHSKLVLIDERIAFIGSMNLTSDSMNRNHEILLKTKTPLEADSFNKVFQEAWKESTQPKEKEIT